MRNNVTRHTDLWREATTPGIDGSGFYVFLDIDGVQNDGAWFKKRHDLRLRSDHSEFMYDACSIDPVLVDRLNRLLDAIPNVHVVLSSTWRHMGVRYVQNCLAFNDFRHKLIGRTPWYVDDDHVRGREIQAWMTEYGIKAEQVLILDDDADMEHLLPRLVKTKFHGHPDIGVDRGGLQEEHLVQAWALLGVTP